jgi:hypothetical protein
VGKMFLAGAVLWAQRVRRAPDRCKRRQSRRNIDTKSQISRLASGPAASLNG